MTTLNNLSPSVGLILIVSTIITTTTTGTGRRRRTITTTKTDVNYGTGFIVDGEIDENSTLKNRNNSARPIVATVAHLLPFSGNNKYYIKLFDKITKISKIYELSLIAMNRSIDICLFDFITPISNPFCIQWDTSDVNAGSTCYLIGYPLGDSQQSIVQGTVRDPTYCFSNLGSGIDQIYHSAPATKGNSGSCILNSQCKIIGIHTWGFKNLSGNDDFENFTGGSSTYGIFKIIGHMISKIYVNPEKFCSRVILGIKARIVNDIFRIQYMDISGVQEFDGILVNEILPNKTIDNYNKGQGVPKIEINDIITHLNDSPIGYCKESPVNVLFTLSQNNPIQIKIRKANTVYQNPVDIQLNNPTLFSIQDDSFYANII
jgi:S1-C subfamily serine protease